MRRSVHEARSSHNPSRAALADRARDKDALPDTLGPRAVLVYDQDRIRRTVDVLLKDRPGLQVIRGVRLANSDWGLRVSPRFRTVKANGEENATVGWIMYPPTDHTGMLVNNLIRRPYSERRFMSAAPIFFATSYTDTDNPDTDPIEFDPSDTAGTDPDVIGPNDDYMGSPWGQFIIFKANGDLVFRVPGNIYGFGTDEDLSDAKPVARQGDAGDGMGGGIGGGSSRVHWGG